MYIVELRRKREGKEHANYLDLKNWRNAKRAF